MLVTCQCSIWVQHQYTGVESVSMLPQFAPFKFSSKPCIPNSIVGFLWLVSHRKIDNHKMVRKKCPFPPSPLHGPLWVERIQKEWITYFHIVMSWGVHFRILQEFGFRLAFPSRCFLVEKINGFVKWKSRNVSCGNQQFQLFFVGYWERKNKILQTNKNYSELWEKSKFLPSLRISTSKEF